VTDSLRQVLVPLPDNGFDVTEVAVPWKLLTEAGYSVVFATETGRVPAADPLLVWADLNTNEYGGLILPGGHAPGMRQYLGGVQLIVVLQHIGEAEADEHAGGHRWDCDDARHDRAVRNAEVLDAVHAQVGVDDGAIVFAHPARA
jgi:putative intracellular protease/amidase